MSDTIRVIVADDHPLFLDGLVLSLAAASDIEVAGQAVDAAGAIRVAREQAPDVALLDVIMPGSGLRAAHDIALSCPTTKIVMLSVSQDEGNVRAAMHAGAAGYVLKGVSPRELADVIRAVHAGATYVAPQLAGSFS